MDGFLDAECVIGALFRNGVFIERQWKLNKVTASSYDVSFELANSARIAGFTIFIKGTYHCVGLPAILNHARGLISVDDIISLCAIP
jgi:hypothetical protein